MPGRPGTYSSTRVPGSVLGHAINHEDFQRRIVLLFEGLKQSLNVLAAVSHHYQHTDQRTGFIVLALVIGPRCPC